MNGSDIILAPQPFLVVAYTDDEELAAVTIQIDTADTFDTANLVELVSELDEPGEAHTLSQALLGTQSWYLRAKAIREDEEASAWTPTAAVNVDTGGALPTSISPDPGSLVRLSSETFIVEWSAVIDHVLTPTVAKTLRLRVQADQDPGFSAPTTATSVRMLGGQRATVLLEVTTPGTYWVRFAALADHGDGSAWDTYEVSITLSMAFTQEPRWEGQIGPRPNRVYARIQGGVTYQVASVPDVPAAERVDYWIEVPAGTSNGEALATAQAALSVLQARTVSVSGSVPLAVTAAFGNLVGTQWWERDGDTSIMREQHLLVLAKKRHDVDAGTTTLDLGDYAPPAEELLARLLAKLARTM